MAGARRWPRAPGERALTWHDINWLDLSIALVVVTSALVALLTGFLRELVSVASLSLSIALAATYHDDLGLFIERWLDRPDIASAAAFFAILVVSWALSGTVGLLLAGFLPRVGVGVGGRLSASLLGCIKGFALATIVLMVLTVYLPPDNAAFRASRLYPIVVKGARAFAGVLPLEERLILLRRLEKRPEPALPAGSGFV